MIFHYIYFYFTYSKGNIIPAIATTNAIIAGLMVIECLKVLAGKVEDCRTIYLNKQVKAKNRLLVPCHLEKPNPKCYVCATKPEVIVNMDTNRVTVKQLEDKLFKEKFGMIAPDVEIDDGKGTILISSEKGETDSNWDKMLSDFKINNSTRLKGDDFLQNYELVVIVKQRDDLEEMFVLEGDLPAPPPEDEKPATNGTENSKKRKLDEEVSTNGGTKKAKTNDVIDLDDILLVE